jgi:drug/metabolite transporter (DMT)-like permease
MKFILNGLVFLAYAIFSGSGLIIIKMAMSESAFNWGNMLEVFLRPKFLAGFFLYALGFLVWMVILSRFKLNVAYPVSVSLFFAVTLLGSYFILGEQFSLLHGIGVLFCFLGVLLIALK